MLHANGNGTCPYHTQKAVFDDVGEGVLANAYAGFNTSLFAYGQTGAGKSYSMVGYGKNSGIVPLAFNALFEKIESDPGACCVLCRVS